MGRDKRRPAVVYLDDARRIAAYTRSNISGGSRLHFGRKRQATPTEESLLSPGMAVTWVKHLGHCDVWYPARVIRILDETIITWKYRDEERQRTDRRVLIEFEDETGATVRRRVRGENLYIEKDESMNSPLTAEEKVAVVKDFLDFMTRDLQANPKAAAPAATIKMTLLEAIEFMRTAFDLWQEQQRLNAH